MKNVKNGILLLVVLLTFINLLELSSAAFSGSSSGFSVGSYQTIGSVQFNQPSFYSAPGINVRDYWGDFNKENCDNRQDFIVMIPPGGCSPAVVTSDLLEEENVPVFCKVSSIQLNPLMDVTKIRSIRFEKKDLPDGVSGVSYFPARAAIRSTNKQLIGSPVVDNIGYLVVVLKKQASEKDMADFLEGNLTAVIDYQAEGIWGVGQQSFFLGESDESDWLSNYRDSGFWNGKAYVRAEMIEEDSATISIYQNPERKVASVRLSEGETSNTINLGGYYCSAGLKVKLESLDYPKESALIRVDDQDIWVAKGSKFLEDKCTVRDLDIYDAGGGKIDIFCKETGSSGKFSLLLNSHTVNLEVDGNEKNVSIGEVVKASKDNNKYIYLAYTGSSPRAKGNFVVFIKSGDDSTTFQSRNMGNYLGSLTENYRTNGEFVETLKQLTVNFMGPLTSISNLWNLEEKQFFNYLVRDINSRYNIAKEDIVILNFNADGVGMANKWGEEGITLKSFFSSEQVLEENNAIKGYYDEAINNYNDVFELYPSENIGQNVQEDVDVPYGAIALKKAADLSAKLGMKGEQINYLNMLIEEYPLSNVAGTAENELRSLYRARASKDSQALVNINSQGHFISLMDFKRPGYLDLGAEIIVSDSGKSSTEYLLMDTIMTTPNSRGSYQVSEIGEDYVEIIYYASTSENVIKGVINYFNQNTYGTKVRLEEGKSQQITSEVSMNLVKTNLKKQAEVKIIPETKGTRSYSNFSFHIGIEKRAIKLSPEKTQDMIDNIRRNIKEWNDVNEKLGKLVKGMKTACFATSAMFTVKNFFGGLSGEAQARSEVMTARGGWNDKCKEIVSAGQAVSIEKCLLDNNDKINNDVKNYAAQLKETNDALKIIQQSGNVESTNDWLSESYNINEMTKEYRDGEFSTFLNSADALKTYKLPDGTETTIKGLVGDNADQLTIEEMRDIVTLSKTSNSGGVDSVLDDISNKKIESILNEVDLDLKYKTASEKAKTSFVGYGVNAFENNDGTLKIQPMDTLNTDTSSKLDGATQGFVTVPMVYRDGDNIVKAAESINGKSILVGLEQSGGEYKIKKAIDSDDKDVTQDIHEYYADRGITMFTKADSKLYNNKIKESPLRVEYYENAPYKGLPSLVPFDENEGWYVATDYVVSGFGAPYDASGRAVNFWICNVGDNGLIEYKRGDDCRYYNVGTSASISFPGLDSRKSQLIVEKAQAALMSAAKQYGKSKVSINGRSYQSGISDNGNSGKCSDFMSSSDCQLIFNLCDPVICPASRCDFGGNYRVDDVIQSGIIGSLMLCLPNAKEGIAVPVCLTGIHAGIENYVSILNSTQKCLQESLETGRNIGICDEIKSIYICEFFWKQAVPLMDVFIPKLFEMAIGQGARGGGEYLTTQAAWENAQNSVNYFKNDYAVNSLKAFNLRSTAEVGGDVCKAFIGARYPNSADMFDNLVEPDSPAQYSGWFSEDVLNSATIPPTSHYKVYYHIYAGNDYGTQYLVYLKAPQQTGLVHSLGSYTVDSGYIGKGSQADEAKDFIAVSGFTELCISINGKEECGFKQVTTSFALDYLKDSYMKEQVSEVDIKTSEECVAGKTSAYSLVQPNLQSGVEEMVQPEIYKRGVIRVCSSENPGKAVDAKSGDLDSSKLISDRWQEVGICDDPSIICWVDTNSVEDVLAQNKLLLNQTLTTINTNYVDQIDYLTEGDSKEIIDSAKILVEEINAKNSKDFIVSGNVSLNIVEVLSLLKSLSEKGLTNNYKVQGLYYAGMINDVIAGKLYERTSESLRVRTADVVEKTSESPGVDSVSVTKTSGGTKGIKVDTESGSSEDINDAVVYNGIDWDEDSIKITKTLTGKKYIYYNEKVTKYYLQESLKVPGTWELILEDGGWVWFERTIASYMPKNPLGSRWAIWEVDKFPYVLLNADLEKDGQGFLYFDFNEGNIEEEAVNIEEVVENSCEKFNPYQIKINEKSYYVQYTEGWDFSLDALKFNEILITNSELGFLARKSLEEGCASIQDKLVK